MRIPSSGKKMTANDSPPTFEIPLQWRRILVGDDRFDWHKKRVRSYRDRDQLAGARVYKWVLQAADLLPTMWYIGQCQDFQKRLGKYRTTLKKGPEARFRCEAQRYLEAGGTVDLYFLDLKTPLCINGKRVDELSLGELDVRLMMESIAIVSARAAGFEMVNRLGGNVTERRIRGLIEKIVREKGFKFLWNRLGLDKEGDENQ